MMWGNIYIICIFMLFAKTGLAATAYFGLVIGNNEPPQGEKGLKRLQYADDDAVRFQEFLTHLNAQTILIAQLDKTTQNRYRSISSKAQVASLNNIKQAVVRLKKKIASAKAKGKQTVVYFFFSGHGAFNKAGNPYLSLVDGEVSRTYLYQEIMQSLDADYQHVFIDACYAGGIVGAKGMFDNEVDGKGVTVTSEQLNLLSGANADSRFPSMGFVVSASKEKRTHEWSMLESGVFTHQVLSGLYGAADVNLDGLVEYSELTAFVDAANSMVVDERFRLSVVSKAPSRNKNAAIVKLSTLKNVSFLYGSPQKLGHFFIEDQSGNRYLDANLTVSEKMHVAVPKNRKMYLHANAKEAPFLLSNQNLNVSALQFERENIRAKGSVESALRNGLFSMGFGSAYYLGHVNARDDIPVDFNATPFYITPSSAMQGDRQTLKLLKRWSIASFVLGGSLAIASGLTAVWSKRKKDAFANTVKFDKAEQFNKEYKRYGNAALVLSIAATAMIATGVVFTIKYKRKSSMIKQVRLFPAAGGVGLDAWF